jgi:hypothetical protein
VIRRLFLKAILATVVALSLPGLVAAQTSAGLSSGEYYLRTANLPARTAYTIAGWVKATSLPGALNTIFSLENATSSAGQGCYLGFETPSGANANLVIATDAGQTSLRTFAYNSWAFVAIVGNGTTVTVYTRLEGEGSLTSASMAQSAFTEAALYINNDSYAESLDASYRYVRVWGAALSSGELLSESSSATPVRTSNLNANYPMSGTADDDEDQSGNGFNSTLTGTVSVLGTEPTIGGGGGGSSGTRSRLTLTGVGN